MLTCPPFTFANSYVISRIESSDAYDNCEMRFRWNIARTLSSFVAHAFGLLVIPGSIRGFRGRTGGFGASGSRTQILLGRRILFTGRAL
jgi:hypothetical protein